MATDSPANQGHPALASPAPMTPGYTSNPMMYMHPTPTPSMSTFLTNVKLDVRAYPVFNGENATWGKFKRGVVSLASTYNLDDVFVPNFIVPSPGSLDFQLFHERNKLYTPCGHPGFLQVWHYPHFVT